MPLHYDGEVQIYKVPHMGNLDNNGYILRCPKTSEAIIIRRARGAGEVAE